MKGNVNKNVEINEEDRYFHNVLMEKIIVNPLDPLHPIVRKYLKVFRAIDYKKYFQCPVEEQIGYLKAANYQNAELVHDPTLEKIEIPEPLSSFEEKFRMDKKVAQAIDPMKVRVRKPIKGIKK